MNTLRSIFHRSLGNPSSGRDDDRSHEERIEVQRQVQTEPGPPRPRSLASDKTDGTEEGGGRRKDELPVPTKLALHANVGDQTTNETKNKSAQIRIQLPNHKRSDMTPSIETARTPTGVMSSYLKSTSFPFSNHLLQDSATIPCLRDMQQDMLEYLCHVTLFANNDIQRHQSMKDLRDLSEQVLVKGTQYSSRFRIRLMLTALAWDILRCEEEDNNNGGGKQEDPIVKEKSNGDEGRNGEKKDCEDDDEEDEQDIDVVDDDEMNLENDFIEIRRFDDMVLKDWESLLKELNTVRELLLRQQPSSTTSGTLRKPPGSERRRRRASLLGIEESRTANQQQQHANNTLESTNHSKSDDYEMVDADYYYARSLIRRQVALTKFKDRLEEILLTVATNEGSELQTFDSVEFKERPVFYYAIEDFSKRVANEVNEALHMSQELALFAKQATSLLSPQVSVSREFVFQSMDKLISDLRKNPQNETSYHNLKQTMHALLIRWSECALETPVLFELGYGGVRTPGGRGMQHQQPSNHRASNNSERPKGTIVEIGDEEAYFEPPSLHQGHIQHQHDNNGDDVSSFGGDATAADQRKIPAQETNANSRDGQDDDDEIGERHELLTEPVAPILDEHDDDDVENVEDVEQDVEHFKNAIRDGDDNLMTQKPEDTADMVIGDDFLEQQKAQTAIAPLPVTDATTTQSIEESLSFDDKRIIARLALPKPMEKQKFVYNNVVKYPRHNMATKTPRNSWLWRHHEVREDDIVNRINTIAERKVSDEDGRGGKLSKLQPPSFSDDDESETQDPFQPLPARKKLAPPESLNAGRLSPNSPAAQSPPRRAKYNTLPDSPHTRQQQQQQYEKSQFESDLERRRPAAPSPPPPAAENRSLQRLLIDELMADSDEEDVFARNKQRKRSRRSPVPACMANVGVNDVTTKEGAGSSGDVQQTTKHKTRFEENESVHLTLLPAGGRTRVEFTEEETTAIIAGVKRWGVGKWRIIKDQSGGVLDGRTPIQIKDKYRNLVRTNQI